MMKSDRSGGRNRLGSDSGVAPPRLLSIEDLADLLQVPKTTIYEWRYRGEGPRSIRVGKYVRFHPDDVAIWVEAQRASSLTGKG
jgi:excisionase family DNA binding protein